MAPYPVTDLVDYLRGAWDLARNIVGVDGSALGTFTGTAEFAWHDGELRYHEQGQLRLNDHQGSATRTLQYRPESTSRCSVWFVDGHFFHDLQLDTGTWEVRHPCRADLYYGYFEVTGADQWLQHWRVAGPEKAYEMTTTFTRGETPGEVKHPPICGTARPPARDCRQQPVAFPALVRIVDTSYSSDTCIIDHYAEGSP